MRLKILSKIKTKNELTEEEKRLVLKTLKKRTKGLKIEGVCIYGSRISGYAKSHSDYDLIVVINNYQQRIRYQYIFDQIEISAIFVDSNALQNDAKNGELGEFVIGRLLNPYEPLINDDFFYKIEYEYKRRVIIETIDELHSEYSFLIQFILIPIDYFLFKRLRQRISIYPPVKYSYTMTYGGNQKNMNMKKSLKLFKVCLKELHTSGKIVYDNKFVRLKVKKKNSKKIYFQFRYLSRMLRHYYIHILAGRVKPGIVQKELLSKIRRNKEINQKLEHLNKPKKLLVIK